MSRRLQVGLVDLSSLRGEAWRSAMRALYDQFKTRVVYLGDVFLVAYQEGGEP